MLKELIRNATMRLVEILTGFIDSLETWLDEYFGVTLDGLDLSDLDELGAEDEEDE